MKMWGKKSLAGTDSRGGGEEFGDCSEGYVRYRIAFFAPSSCAVRVAKRNERSWTEEEAGCLESLQLVCVDLRQGTPHNYDSISAYLLRIESIMLQQVECYLKLLKCTLRRNNSKMRPIRLGNTISPKNDTTMIALRCVALPTEKAKVGWKFKLSGQNKACGVWLGNNTVWHIPPGVSRGGGGGKLDREVDRSIHHKSPTPPREAPSELGLGSSVSQEPRANGGLAACAALVQSSDQKAHQNM